VHRFRSAVGTLWSIHDPANVRDAHRRPCPDYPPTQIDICALKHFSGNLRRILAEIEICNPSVESSHMTQVKDFRLSILLTEGT
jgi:hypothetical protein